LQRVNASSFN
jgi:hypothetical protein